MKWTITYYNKQVFEKILKLPASLAGKFVAITERMMEKGAYLGLPYTKAMGKGLFEIRLKGQEGIARIFYCTQKGKEIIILHSFIKKTQKAPKNELEIAIKHLNEVKKNG